MNNERVEIELRRAPDDPRVNSPEFQTELREFGAALKSSGVTYSQVMMTFDAAQGGGFPLPEFLIAVQWLAPSLASVLVAWIATRNGRKVRIKCGDIEVEGRTMQEVEQAFERVAAYAKQRDGEP